jgi:hypothetical protein
MEGHRVSRHKRQRNVFTIALKVGELGLLIGLLSISLALMHLSKHIDWRYL